MTLIHNISEIVLFNNSFLGFSSRGNILMNFKRYANTKTYLFVSECEFINNKNDYSIFQIGHASSLPLNVALNFSKCKFIKNICYEGNGGAIALNINHELSLTNCCFINNKAFLHGGALTLYKNKRVDIISCIFEKNEANCILTSFHKQDNKQKGRGGALYIYSSFSYIKNDYTKIFNCTFKSNSAFDGYAIYIGGNDEGQKIIINKNTFNDNYDKSSNSRSKGVISSEIKNIYSGNVVDSNIFKSKEETFQNSILYVNHNMRTLHLILAGLVLLVIIVIIINITNNSKQDNTFIFVIIGSSARKLYESSTQKNIQKYGNYCFSSYALLIKRLVLNHLRINKQHICIFGRGKEENYNINSIIPNNKIIVQLTIDEIYETESSQSELEIIPYKNVEDIIITMRSIIDVSKCKNPNIILFLYDHGDEKSFGKLNFFELYLKILNIPHSSLCIYNESCKSKSMIIKIKNYFTISEIIRSFTPKITQDELFYLALVAKEINPKGNFTQLDTIQSLDRKYYKYVSKRHLDNTFSYLCLFAEGEIQLEQLYQKFPSIFSENDIDSLANIIKNFIFKFRIPDNYEVIHLVFEKGTRVIQKILKTFNFNNEQFFDFIYHLRENKQNFADIQYKMHPNHSIVTSSHEKGPLPTYGTLRVNENTKIIPGSPAMASYIIEVLMNRSLSKKNIDKIKKMVYGDHEGLMMEYATQCLQPKKKKWIRLNINYWESKSFFKKRILNNQDNNYMANHTIEEVMNSIGFKLLSRCEIIFDSQNKCVTNKMQPLYKSNSNKKSNVIGIRLVAINKNVDYSLGEIEYDDYYSDGNDRHESNNNDHDEDNNNNNGQYGSNNNSNHLETAPNYSFEDLFDDFNCDSVITQSHFDRIISEVKIEDLMIYPVRIIVIFDYELKKIAENKIFIKKYPYICQEVPKKTPSIFRLNMSNWIDHFFPTYELEEEIDNFILRFYQFIVKHEIPEKDAKSIFYNIMNAADQVASQLSNIDKKEAYYPERLKRVNK
ncbi:hypothetical protein M9Y10_005179 [Tritrichomonas musculus]|uniref:Right handed beta helix domain-containing protein n=1 Tax=Tritrichomonas musculus TaxID=1915356 RepID=A0ABR2JM91_9EUKA